MVPERRFPVLRGSGRTIPWSVAELAYATYAEMYGTRQTLEVIASRGGFAPQELDMLLPTGYPWWLAIKGGRKSALERRRRDARESGA